MGHTDSLLPNRGQFYDWGATKNQRRTMVTLHPSTTDKKQSYPRNNTSEDFAIGKSTSPMPEIAAEACLGRTLEAAPRDNPTAAASGRRRLGLTLYAGARFSTRLSSSASRCCKQSYSYGYKDPSCNRKMTILLERPLL